MSSTGSKVFHLVVVVYYYLVSAHIFNEVSPRILRDFPLIRDGIVVLLIQLITFWTLVVQIVFFLCALGEDLLELLARDAARKTLKEFTDTFFIHVVWPMTSVVVINFWIIYAIDVRMLDPFYILFDYISWDLNHVIHTYVAVLMVVEALTNHRPHRKDILYTVQRSVYYFGVYFSTTIATQPFGTIWTYPFFRDMSCIQWALYITSNILLALLAHLAGSVLNSLRWGRSITTTSDLIKAQ